MELVHLSYLREALFTRAALFKRGYFDVEKAFGETWARDFDEHLGRLLGDDLEAYRQAALGYAAFSIEAMRLQRLLNVRRRYEDVTYQDAQRAVYLNDGYMSDVYLPGIFVSQFLWRHHYRQLMDYRDGFIPLMRAADDRRFYEVGTGTGFFTVQVLRSVPGAEAFGVDTSPVSRRFTRNHVVRWGLDASFHSLDSDIFSTSLDPLPFLQCVEVLEHLPDPVAFLRRLRAMLQTGGYGYIVAALTAAQSDHIYLYWTSEEVRVHLEAAGFRVVRCTEERAYPGEPGELVPTLAAFIVT